MLHVKFQEHRILGSEEEDFRGFVHIWAWPSSWSRFQDHFTENMFHFPKETPHKNGFDWQCDFKERDV